MKANRPERKMLLRGFVITMLMTIAAGCEKMVKIDAVGDRLSTAQVFQNEKTANAAINNIYSTLRSLTSTLTYRTGLSADELTNFSPAQEFDEYRTNQLLPSTTLPWSVLYRAIYLSNTAIEGLVGSTFISENTKKQLIGEAKFVRAFCYFYLVNLFGDAPLILTSDVNVSATMGRTPVADVYRQIIIDLKEARDVLPGNYSFIAGDRIRANKWVATAMLARVYLYQQEWGNAAEQATTVINSGLYALLDGAAGILNKNNTEAILQIANNSAESNNNITSNFIFTTTPQLICTNWLLNAFEEGDRRKTVWVSSKAYSGHLYYYPYKFTTGAAGSSEWPTALRLSEQYLIRAEAKAMINDWAGAIADVNLLRLKHGALSSPLPTPVSQAAAVDIIMRERQVELFTEYAHRWLDLKRTGRINAVMQQVKPLTWTSSAGLYPIPSADIERNPNLKQNPGYDQRQGSANAQGRIYN